MEKIIVFFIFLGMGFFAKAQTDFRQLTYKEAIAAAKVENKLVFIDFYTEWCGPCKMMMRNIFPQKVVGDYLNATFVCIKIDAEKGEGPELAKRYKVAAYPTFVAIDTREKVVMTKEGGAGDGRQFIAGIKRQIDPNKTPERMKERYEGGERTADLISAYAGMLMEQVYESRRPDMSKKEEAFKMVKDYFNGLKDNERLLVDNLFIYTSFTESTGDEITRFMIANRDKFAPEVKEVIAEKISLLYKMDIYGYLVASKPFDRDEYGAIKKGILDLGLNKDNYYTTTFLFIESYGKGDLNAFLALCEKEYENLSDDSKKSLISNFADLIKTEDETVKKRAAKFIRSQLEGMDASLLYWAALQLMTLEGKDH